MIIALFSSPMAYRLLEEVDLRQREIGYNFLLEIGSCLQLQHEEFSFKEKWRRKAPTDAGRLSLNDYMIKVMILSSWALSANHFQATQDMWYDDYQAFDYFLKQYWAKHQRAPYISPPTHAAWESGKTIVKPDWDEAVRKIDVFRSWFCATFFNVSPLLVVMPIENVAPRYRDDPPKWAWRHY